MSEYSYDYEFAEGAPFTEEQFLGALAAFQAADPITQIIVITFLTVITVGAIIFSIYVIKLVIQFMIKMIKGIVKTASAKPIVSQPSAMIPPQNQVSPVPVVGPNPAVQPVIGQYSNRNSQSSVQPQGQVPVVQQPIAQPLNVQQPEPQVPEFFCSNCGARFSSRMLAMIKTNHKAYCEQCGQGFMVADN